MARIFVKVDAYSGARADERPRSVTIADRTLEVTETIDRWYGPDHEYFKLACDDGCVYIIRHALKTDEWELVMMDAGRGRAGEEGA